MLVVVYKSSSRGQKAKTFPRLREGDLVTVETYGMGTWTGTVAPGRGMGSLVVEKITPCGREWIRTFPATEVKVLTIPSGAQP